MFNGSKDRLHGRPRDTAFSPWSLVFRDPLVERQFHKSHVAQSTMLNRAYLVVGLLTYLLYAALDIMVAGEDLTKVLTIRMTVCAILLSMIIATYWQRSYLVLQWMHGIGMAVSGGGIILMMIVMSEPFSYLYYAGLILVIIFASNLLMLRYVYSILLCSSIFVAAIFTMIYINPVQTEIVISNTFFLFVTLALACWTAYLQEVFVRRAFSQRYLLRQEAKRAVKLTRVAEAGNKAKSEFLAIVSHELRTPLNAIIGFSEIMEQQMFGPIGDEKYTEYVSDIADSGRHLLGIINGILDLSRAEAGKLEMKEDDVDLVDVIDRTMKVMREEAGKKGVRLGFTPPEKDIVIWADERLMRQVMINLVSNSVKFTQRGGLVDVSVDFTSSGGVRVEVSDTGVGIAEDKIDLVVEPFIQVESAMARENGGVGLGLPLVKKIAEMHDTKLKIESELGVGTTVTLVLPVARCVGEAPRGQSSL